MGTLLSFGPRARARVPRTLGDEGPAFNRKRTANGGPFDELQCANLDSRGPSTDFAP